MYRNKKRISLTTETGRQGNHPPKCTAAQVLTTMRPGTKGMARQSRSHTTLELMFKQESIATDRLHAAEVLQDTVKALDFYLTVYKSWK